MIHPHTKPPHLTHSPVAPGPGATPAPAGRRCRRLWGEEGLKREEGWCQRSHSVPHKKNPLSPTTKILSPLNTRWSYTLSDGGSWGPSVRRPSVPKERTVRVGGGGDWCGKNSCQGTAEAKTQAPVGWHGPRRLAAIKALGVGGEGRQRRRGARPRARIPGAPPASRQPFGGGRSRLRPRLRLSLRVHPPRRTHTHTPPRVGGSPARARAQISTQHYSPPLSAIDDVARSSVYRVPWYRIPAREIREIREPSGTSAIGRV